MTQSSADTKQNEGVELSRAVETYCPEELWNQHVTAENALVRAYSTDGRVPISYDEPNIPPECLPDEQDRRWHKALTLRKEIQSIVVGMLREGSLLAIGYSKPRLRNAKLEWIDTGCWELAEILWEESELLSGRLSYEKVRVLKSPTFQGDDSETASVITRTVGGPSLQKEITRAYEVLRDNNKIDFERSLRANLPVIQKAVRELTDRTRPLADIRGIKYEAVRVAIGEQFKQDRAAHKSR